MTVNSAAEPTGTPGCDQPINRPLRYRGHRLDGAVRELHAAAFALRHGLA